MIKKSTRKMVKINQRMIKKLTRGVVQMIIIVLVIHLIASVIKFIGAGGRELIIHRATTAADCTPSVRRATTVAIVYLTVNML